MTNRNKASMIGLIVFKLSAICSINHNHRIYGIDLGHSDYAHYVL